MALLFLLADLKNIIVLQEVIGLVKGLLLFWLVENSSELENLDISFIITKRHLWKTGKFYNSTVAYNVNKVLDFSVELICPQFYSIYIVLNSSSESRNVGLQTVVHVYKQFGCRCGSGTQIWYWQIFNNSRSRSPRALPSTVF